MNGLKIKKAAAILLALVCALAFAGCGGVGQTSSDTALVGAKAEPEKEFKVEKFNLKFRTPADWKDDNKDTELDWYCGNDSVGMGIFGYYRSDFASGTNIIDILSQQSKDNTEPWPMPKNFKMLESIIDSFEIEKGGEK